MDEASYVRMLDPDRPRAGSRLTGRVIGYTARLAWRADRGALLVCVGVSVLQAAGTAGMLLVARSAAATVLTPAGTAGAVGAIVGPAALIAATVLLSLVLTAISGHYQRVLTEKVELAAMEQVLTAATAADLLRYEDPAFYDRVTRAREAAGTHLRLMVIALLTGVHTAIYTIAVGATVIAMAWFAVPFLLLAILPIWLTSRRINHDWHQLLTAQVESRRTATHLEHILTGRDQAAEIRAFNAGRELLRRWQHIRHDLLGHQNRLNRANEIRRFGANILSQTITLATIAAMGVLVHLGTVSLATAGTVLVAIYLLAHQFHALGSLLSLAGKSLLFIADITTFTRDTHTHPTPPTPTPPAPLTPRPFSTLTARGVGFTYPGQHTPALHDINLDIHAGQVIALVGYNGSGKTTLTKILAGLYPPTTGTLHRDNTAITHTDLPQLQASTTILLQDHIRYPLPATDNIALGDPTPDPDRLTHAATAAGIAEHLTALPHHYNTPLTTERTNGVDLSGGQWQKIALARAFYRDTPLIILDEPATALDPQAEADLYHHIRDLFTDHTIILVTHRMTSVRHADHIYVLDTGRITESGTHHQLMHHHGTYHHLYTLQTTNHLQPHTTTPTLEHDDVTPPHNSPAIPTS